MSDIIQRLRDQGRDAFAKQYSLGMWKLCDEAASEIERLEQELNFAFSRIADKDVEISRLSRVAEMTG